MAGTAQIVDGLVMRNPKQPGAHIGHLGGGKCGVSFGEGLLHQILGVDDRANHARAITVQLRANVLNQRFELGRYLRRCERTRWCGHVSLTVLIQLDRLKDCQAAAGDPKHDATAADCLIGLPYLDCSLTTTQESPKGFGRAGIGITIGAVHRSRIPYLRIYELKRKNPHQYGERIDEGFVAYCNCCDGRRVVEPAYLRLSDEQRRLGAAGYLVAASGVAVTPSCCIMLIWSNSRHVSTILPLAI